MLDLLNTRNISNIIRPLSSCTSSAYVSGSGYPIWFTISSNSVENDTADSLLKPIVYDQWTAFVEPDSIEPNIFARPGSFVVENLSAVSRQSIELIISRRRLNAEVRVAPVFPFAYSLHEPVEFHNRWDLLREKLGLWSKLPNDWDGDDGVPPSATAVRAAKRFLSLGELQNIPIPTPYVAGDGEVGFRWSREDDFASVAFPSDGHIVVFCRSPSLATPIRLDILFSSQIDLGGLFSSLKDFS